MTLRYKKTIKTAWIKTKAIKQTFKEVTFKSITWSTKQANKRAKSTPTHTFLSAESSKTLAARPEES